MLPSILSKEIIRGLQSYITTGFETPTPYFQGVFTRLVNAPGQFHKGPYLTIQLPFRVGTIGSDYFSSLDTGFLPYIHQQKAWERLSSRLNPRSTLVATGTGSGKTECFLYPILDHCAHTPGSGVKAIVIYPMNALATDQAKRFARAIHESEALRGKIRVGLFVGGLEEDAPSKMGADTVITDRSVLRRDPPDILLTNYKMLDFLLLRPRDQKLWEKNAPDTLRYLVVDELHTFDGAQGTDLACLIRRLKARLLGKDSPLICVGTSATLGSSDEQDALTQYAEKIFQTEFDRDAIVGESRLEAGEFLDAPIEYLLAPGEGLAGSVDVQNYSDPLEYLIAQYQVFFPGQPTAQPSDAEWCKLLGQQLKRHLLFNNLLRMLVKQPRLLGELHQELAQTLPGGEVREQASAILDSLCALISVARDSSGRPLVNLRLQLWVRELRRMVVPLSGEEPTLAFADDKKKEDDGIYLPLVQCNQCNATAWLTRKPESTSQVETDLRGIYSAFFNQSPEIYVLLPLVESESEPQTAGYQRHLCLHCGQLQSGDGACLACGDEALQRVFVPNLIKQKQVNGAPRLVSERNCPVCGQKDSLLVFGARSASLSSVAIHHIYATRFNDDKKLIAFSDSVQDAAHRAGFFAARTWQNNIRMAITKALPEESISLVDFFQHFPHFWLENPKNPQAMDQVRFIVEFIAPNMQYYQDYRELTRTGKLPPDSDLVSDVSKRLVWEVLAEFGYRAPIGRSLERTGVAALGFDLELVDRAVKELLPILQEQEGLFDITEQGMRWFLLGLLLRLKQRGAIYHRFLDSYIQEGGKNFMLSRQSYLPPFAPQTRAPVFLTNAPSHAEFDCLVPKKGLSWYQSWLTKCLGAEQMMMPEKIEGPVYQRVLKCLEVVGLLQSSETRGYQVWALNPEYLRLSSNVTCLETPHTRDRLIVPETIADAITGMPSLGMNDPGRYGKSEKRDSWLAQLYRNGEIRRVIAAEHTGLLERAEREEIEREFMDGSDPWCPNLLSATPTLEMGIDIGDLSSLLLCSVPPAQANYLQRIGRAGRRDGNAFNLTVAAGSPHDLYFYADPLQMMAGRVDPPGVFLNASAVISRQLTAFCMDRWVMTGLEDDAIPRTLKPVLDNVKKGEIHHFPYNFVAFVKQRALPLLDDFLALFGDELSESTQKYLRRFILGEGSNDGLEMRLVKRLHELLEERERFKKRVEQLKRHLDKLGKLPSDEAIQNEIEAVQQERGALQAMLRQINARQALNFLTDEGVIPNYAFPEEGVTLRSVIYQRKKVQKEGEGKYENLVYEYDRPGAAAISELVPNNRFYAGGRKVSIKQVDVSLSDIEQWRFCPSCSFSRRMEGEESVNECPRCSDPMWADSGQQATMMRLRQVMANTSDRDSRIGDDSDDRVSRFFNKQMLVDFNPETAGPAYQIVSEELPFGFEFVRSATFREVNFGEYGKGEETSIGGELLARSGFHLCKYCGMVQDLTNKQQHAFACTAVKSHAEDEENLIDCLYLYREFTSEALRILLPVVSNEGTDRYINSFIAALQLGLKQKFGGQVDHLRVMTYAEPVSESDAKRRYLMLYDSVPGGTGYLHDLMHTPEALLAVFQLSLDNMIACSCNQDPEKDGCYRCLYAYRNSYGMESTSRTTAVELFSQIIEHRDRIEAIDNVESIKINPVFDSELEALFISALAKPGLFNNEVKIQQQVVNGKPGYFLSVSGRYYTIEPQVQVGEAEGVMLASKPDFLICSSNSADEERFIPIAVFLDGFKYHKDKAAEDSAKRLALVRSGRYRVWSLTWDDVHTQYAGTQLKIRNPFTEGLQPQMQPVQQRLNDELGISNLYKIAINGTMAQLVAYLTNPISSSWQGLALVRLIGWLDQRTMRDPDIENEYHQRFQQDAPTYLSQCFQELGEAAYGGLNHSNDPLRIDCAIPLSSISQADPGTVLCNIQLDDRDIEVEGFKQAWQAFLRVFNLLQFLPLAGFTSAKGMAAGLYESIQWKSSDSVLTGIRNEEKFELLEEVLEELAPYLKQWIDLGGAAPVVGFELQDDTGEIVAEAEFAWVTEKVAGLLPSQREFKEVLAQLEWKSVELDEAGNWVNVLGRVLDENA